QDERRQQPAGPTNPEIRQVDTTAAAQLVQQQRGDQETTQHEKHGDAGAPASPASPQPIGASQQNEPARGTPRPVPCSPLQGTDRFPGRWPCCRRYSGAPPC